MARVKIQVYDNSIHRWLIMTGKDNDRIMFSDDTVGVGVADGIEANALNVSVLALRIVLAKD